MKLNEAAHAQFLEAWVEMINPNDYMHEINHPQQIDNNAMT